MSIRLNTRLVLAAALAWSAGACQMLEDGSFTIDGTVQFVAVEGGCWRIHGVDSTPYEPTNLPSGFREDGLAVRATLAPRDDLASICQVGRIVDVRAIERR